MRRHQIVSLIAGNLIITLFLAGCGQGKNTPTTNIPTEAPRAEQFDDTHPMVVFKTSLGNLTVELDPKNAPITVDNFLAYVNSAKYDGTIFHQISADYMALGGGYDPHLKERPAEYAIRNEAHNGLKNLKGAIAMARAATAVDSATNQFFFNLADNPSLDYRDRTTEGYGYCVFGRILEGDDVLQKINAVPVADTQDFVQVPTQPVVIETVRRVK